MILWLIASFSLFLWFRIVKSTICQYICANVIQFTLSREVFPTDSEGCQIRVTEPTLLEIHDAHLPALLVSSLSEQSMDGDDFRHPLDLGRRSRSYVHVPPRRWRHGNHHHDDWFLLVYFGAGVGGPGDWLCPGGFGDLREHGPWNAGFHRLARGRDRRDPVRR